MTDETPVLDQSVLDELRDSVGGDQSFIADLAATYLAESPDHLDAMQAAVSAADPAAIIRPAHTLKSSSASLGAMRLSHIAREIEFAGRNGETSGLEERVSAAREAWAQTVAAMKQSGVA
jgi:HPt (histidine-containing phosphotransfer) domain-containing protein